MIQSHDFSEAITQNLLRGGWFPNRKFETTNFSQLWINKGLNWFDSTEAFLKKFSSVSMDEVYSDGSVYEWEYVIFVNPEIYFPGFAQGSRQVLVSLESTYQQTLSPIGTAFELTRHLFVDSENRFYVAGFGDYYRNKPFGKGVIEYVAGNVQDFIEYIQRELTMQD
jgi:hypothetical protein